MIARTLLSIFVHGSSPSGKVVSHELPTPRKLLPLKPPSSSEFSMIFRGGEGGGVGMDIFWNHTFLCTYDSTYDSNFWFSLGHKHSYDSAYDSDFVTNKNQPYSTIIQLLKIKIIV